MFMLMIIRRQAKDSDTLVFHVVWLMKFEEINGCQGKWVFQVQCVGTHVGVLWLRMV